MPRFNRFLVLSTFVLFSASAMAQNLTQSPYSVVGPGDIHFPGTAQLLAMGQTGQAYRRPYEINLLNPASSSALQQTVYEAGFMYTLGSLSNATATSQFDNASFSYFSIGIPLSLKRGVSLVAAILPYSAVGYNLSAKKEYAGNPSITGTTEMQGRGGLSRFLAGTGFRINQYLSAGVQMNYLFGKITRSQQLIFDTSLHQFNLSEERVQVIQDFQFEWSLQFHRSLNDKYKINIGLTYVPQTSMDAKSSFTNRSLGWGGTAMYTADTIEHYENKDGKVVMPQSIKTGISLERKGIWLIGADVNYTAWSDYRAFDQSDNLKNCLSVSVGGSIIPDANAPKNYFQRMEYRLGGRMDNGNLEINGQTINSISLSAGLGFPMGKSKSRLNLGVEYMSRGTTSNNLLREDLFRILLGITFSDPWFIRYKYD